MARSVSRGVTSPARKSSGGVARVPLRRAAGAVLASCLGLLACLLAAAPALAAGSATGQREHVFSSSFSTNVNGASNKKPSSPGAIAVNDTTGDVYVVEESKDAIDQFAPGAGGKMELVRAFAATPANVDAIAVDNSPTSPSFGDVYVGNTAGKLFKFTAEGEEIVLAGKSKPKLETILGLTVGSDGSVYVSQPSGTIAVLTNAVTNTIASEITTALAPNNARRGLARDSAGDFYAGSAFASNEEKLRNLLLLSQEQFKGLNPSGGPEFAVMAELLPTGGMLIPALDEDVSTAVAVNDLPGPGGDAAEQNDVYILHTEGAPGEFSSSLVEYGPTKEGAAGELVQRIALPAGTLGGGVAINRTNGTLYVSDTTTGEVEVYTLPPAGPPGVSGLSAQNSQAGGYSWKLSASVDPRGSDTRSHFEYGTGSCAASACTSTGSADLGEGSGEIPVTTELAGLNPGSIYHYRLVAENASGTTDSEEGTFSIVAGAEGLLDGRKWELVSPPHKNGAEPEAITKEGGVIEAAQEGGAITYVSNGPFAGEEPEGNPSPDFTQILSIRGPEGWFSKDISPASHTATGATAGTPPAYRLFSPNLSLALVEPYPGVKGSGGLASPPLSATETQQKTIYLRADRPLTPEPAGAASFEQAIENGNRPQNENAGYLAVVNDANAKAAFGTSEFANGYADGVEVYYASRDLTHVLFRSQLNATGLYEWSAATKTIVPVGILPNGTTEQNAFAGLSGGTNPNNSISSDGSRVIWSSAAPNKHLYVRDTVANETLQLDAFHGAPESGEPNAVFETASSDGTKIFFTDTQRLTADSRATSTLADLYVFELNAGTHPLTGTLRDLTAKAGAGVVSESFGGGVSGASTDGSYVYFVANGVLAPGAPAGHCPLGTVTWLTNATCNLYVRHFNGSSWEPTKFIAALAVADSPDWGEYLHGVLSGMTSRVSPNGHFFAFMSNRNLTGYEPIDATSGQRDEEVYLYDALTGRLSCASCNPTGAAPHGVRDTGPTFSGEPNEGLGLVVDRPLTWAESTGKQPTPDPWLAGSVPGWTQSELLASLYQSRYLSDSGRLFFNSPDHLVPAAANEKEKVFEFEPQGVGSCTLEAGCVALISGGASEHESAFLDASEDGNDVFFLSTQPLVPNPENNFSIYDAHVCEASSPCPPPGNQPEQACDEEVKPCRPAPGGPENGGTPLTSNLSTSGNIAKHEVLEFKEAEEKKKSAPKALTPAQKLAAALKKCRKLKAGSKRVSCEKAARKVYRAQMLALTLKACHKKSGSKRTSCEKAARKKYGAMKKGSH